MEIESKSIHVINEINLLRKVICEHNSSFEERAHNTYVAQWQRCDGRNIVAMKQNEGA